MADDFAANEDHSGAFSDAEVARVTLELDRQITRQRRAGAMRHIVQGRPLSLPVKPTRIELAVFTAPAQTYGPAMLNRRDLTPVLDCVAERGAVVVVQRVLFGDAWGDAPDDVRLAARLLDARIPFEILCGTWPEVFMAQALAELHRFRLQPPGSSAAIDDGGGDDD